jgi:hypothetical protein
MSSPPSGKPAKLRRDVALYGYGNATFRKAAKERGRIRAGGRRVGVIPAADPCATDDFDLKRLRKLSMPVTSS